VGAVLDAYALIALLGDEPAAARVEDLLERGQATIAAINLAEALDVLERRERIPAEALREALEGLPLRILTAAEPEAWRAASLRARNYHRRRRPVSIADCFLLAAAEVGDAVATGDAALLDAARAEGIEVVDLR